MPAQPRQLQGDEKVSASTPSVPLQGYLERVIDERTNALSDTIRDKDRLLHIELEALKELLQTKIAAMQAATDAAFAASEQAIDKAEKAQTEYNVRSNEFRGQLDDQAKTLMPRNEAAVQFSAMLQKIDDLEKASVSARSALKTQSDERVAALSSQINTINLSLTGMVPQARYDLRHTELAQSFEKRHDELLAQIQALRDYREQVRGQTGQKVESTADNRWIVATIVSIVFGVASLIGLIINLTIRASGG